MANERGPSTDVPTEGSEEEAIVRRPRSRFQRRQDSELKQVFRELGIDIDDVDSMSNARADLEHIRNQRKKSQSRVTTVWSAIIASLVSLLVGGLGVLLSNLVHTGKITP